MDQNLLEHNIELLQQNLMQLIANEDQGQFIPSTGIPIKFVGAHHGEDNIFKPDTNCREFTLQSNEPQQLPKTTSEITSLAGTEGNGALSRLQSHKIANVTGHQHHSFNQYPKFRLIDENNGNVKTCKIVTKCYVSTAEGLQITDREITIPVMQTISERERSMQTRRIHYSLNQVSCYLLLNGFKGVFRHQIDLLVICVTQLSILTNQNAFF